MYHFVRHISIYLWSTHTYWPSLASTHQGTAATAGAKAQHAFGPPFSLLDLVLGAAIGVQTQHQGRDPGEKRVGRTHAGLWHPQWRRYPGEWTLRRANTYEYSTNKWKCAGQNGTCRKRH